MRRHRCIDALHASNGAACSANAHDFDTAREDIVAWARRIVARMCKHFPQQPRTQSATADFAPHKSVCAKTAQDFFVLRAYRRASHTLRGCRKRRTRDVAAAGSWSLDVDADQWSSSSSNSA
jgi:hypothetical protein